MTPPDLVCLGLVIGLTVCLFVALLNPERFQ
jgi:K+-transporting ATPase KdpF subunit